jgi:uncharacterized membrane protein
MRSLSNLILGALLAASIASCNTVPNRVSPSTGASSAALNSVIDHAQDSIGDIKRDAGAILTETATVRQGLALQPSVAPTRDTAPSAAPKPSTVDLAGDALTRIDSKATNIIEAADDLQRETDKLNKLTAEVNQLEKSLTSLQVMLDQSKVKAMEKLYGYISMFWVIGFLLIAGGAAVAFFLNKTYGASLAFIGLLMIGFASASQYYMEEIALVGAILLVLGFLTAIGMIAWSTINAKRSGTAVREIVEMIQILKETMTPDEQERIFGVNGVAAQVQSDLTKEIIAKIKEQNGFKKLEEARKALRAPSTTNQDPASGSTV